MIMNSLPPTALHSATESFSPARLTLAREAAGLTKVALAQRIDTSASVVSQYELGKTTPSAETLARLALALAVPPGFFGRGLERPLSTETCHFRRARQSTRAGQRRVLAQGTLLMLLADELEQTVEFPRPAMQSMRQECRQSASPEDAAEAVRDGWGLGRGPIANVASLLESRGVFVLEVEGHSRKLDAFSTWRDQRPVVFVSNEKGSASRRRFDLAHELGHLLLHSSDDVCDPAAEEEADSFASALLLPREPFMAECPSRLVWPHLRELKRRWGASLQALVRRAHDLGIYSEATYRRAFVQLNKYGWRKNEPDEPPMEHGTLIHRGIELLRGSGVTEEEIAAAVPLSPARLGRLLAGAQDEPTLALF